MVMIVDEVSSLLSLMLDNLYVGTCPVLFCSSGISVCTVCPSCHPPQYIIGGTVCALYCDTTVDHCVFGTTLRCCCDVLIGGISLFILSFSVARRVLCCETVRDRPHCHIAIVPLHLERDAVISNGLLPLCLSVAEYIRLLEVT